MEFYTHILSFSCLGETCPDNCCSGWRVQASSDDYHRLQKHLSKEDFKQYLEKTDHGWCLSQDEKRCKALTDTGLCAIQMRHGHDVLPQTCASYPRVGIQINDDDIEVGGLLSCPEIARLSLTSNSALQRREESQSIQKNILDKVDGNKPYHQHVHDVRNTFCGWLVSLDRYDAIRRIATVSGLSPAFFNQASAENAWDDCLIRAASRFEIPVTDNRLLLYETLVTQVQNWSQRLAVYAKPVARLKYALDNLNINTIEDDLQEWQEGWRESEQALDRYWMHYLHLYSYTCYPDLAQYILRLAISTALIRWLCAAHKVNSIEGTIEMVYSVERLIEHSAWKLNGVAEFQKLKLPARDMIIGLAL